MRFCYLFIVLLFASCQHSPNLTTVDVSYKKKSTVVLDTGKSTEAHFIIPNCSGDVQLSNTLNAFFLNKTAEILGIDVNKEKVTYQYLIDDFIFGYEKMVKMLPLDTTPWDAKITGNVNEQSTIYNPYLSYYVFSGGTNVEEGIKAGFFDKNTKSSIKLKDLFLNYVKFEQLVEQSFVEHFGSYKTDEFYFEKGKFKLAENHYIKDNYWIVSYASGEIAPMYKGVFEVKIPMEDLQSVLNPIYF